MTPTPLDQVADMAPDSDIRIMCREIPRMALQTSFPTSNNKAGRVAQYLCTMWLSCCCPPAKSARQRAGSLCIANSQPLRQSAEMYLQAPTRMKALLDGLKRIDTAVPGSEAKRAAQETPSPKHQDFEVRLCREIGATLFRFKKAVPFTFFQDVRVRIRHSSLT